MKILEILNEDTDKTTALSELNQKIKLLGDNFVPIPYEVYERPNPSMPGTFIKKFSKIIEKDDRPMVLFNFSGTHIPFYISTGEGGKKNVATGKWYPIFGIGPNGWFNKGTENDINNFYGSSKLKRVADFLDSNLGDIRHLGDRGAQIIPIPTLNNAKNFINKDLNPVNRGDSRELFDKNIDDTLQKIGEKPYYKKVVPSPVNKPVEKPEIKPEIKSKQDPAKSAYDFSTMSKFGKPSPFKFAENRKK